MPIRRWSSFGLMLVASATLIAPGVGTPKDMSSGVFITPAAQKEIGEVEVRIDATEDRALAQLRAQRLDRSEQITLLGKLIYFDKNLSVNRNEACVFCHMPEVGFTGGISALNATTGSYPGSVRTRFSNRKPMSHTYATYAAVLHDNVSQEDFVGGNFWDMRATGIRLNQPSAEQAQGPPLNPVEMGLPDSACVVYRLSQRPYRALSETIWGPQAFVIHWPVNVEQLCRSPGPAPASVSLPVHLNAVDRGSSNRTFDQFAEAIATFEASTDVNPFTSKYDYVLAGKAEFTADEKAGYAPFRSSATHCNECHRDGGPGEEPLFTDFTASNLGVPRNPDLPFYKESTPDQFGYTANPLGAGFVDLGVGGFLRHHLQLSAEQNPNSQWEKLAPAFAGKFKVPTLRNVDMRPRPEFVKAYMHNGYFKSLKEVVHFYNTRDVLPRCQANDPGEKVSCWPPPEYSTNENKRQLGNLHLTDQQENRIVAFMKTLTGGYVPQEK
jgi:cytochrome c peroxidase